MGKVYLVGAGPGAVDLITVRGAALLARADIVFHDALVAPETLALAAKAKLVAVGKRCSRISTDQRFINRNLVEAAAKYGVVVRLKGGDPMLFGRAQEEIDALAAAGIEFEIVPGVTAALAGSAEIGVSLTRRGVSRSVVFATPRVGEGEETADWAPAVANGDTAVLYMAAGQAVAIAAVLEAHGMSPSTPVVIVENASLSGVRRIGSTLRGLREGVADGLAGPALLLLGDVLRAQAHLLVSQASLAAGHADGPLPRREA
ncbi:MAG TPA: uroporphyrinogen-III C-methyltransferase [Burkholderiales bacterium]|nr:uroporphyrinogen-III C-methyltransferase [Burkholderiales bacterium]